MNKFNNRGFFSVIGIIIASIIVIPFMMWIANFFKSKNDFSSIAPAYFEDVIEVPVRLAQLPQLKKSSHSRGYETVDHTVFYSAIRGRDNSKYVTENSKIDRDVHSGKYFKIMMIVPSMSMDANDYFVAMEKQDSLILLVNETEFREANKCNKNDPCLIFGIRGAEKPLTWIDITRNQVHNVYIKPEQYRYSAEMYWIYIATKEEFERRFGKQK